MKSLRLVIVISFLLNHFQSFSQETTLGKSLDLELKGMSLIQAIDSIENRMDISIAYDSHQLAADKKVNFSTKSKPIYEVLKKLFSSEFEILEQGNRFILKALPQKKSVLYGYITEAASGETLPGATVYLNENPSIGTVSNIYGYYSLTLPAGSHQLVISYLGFETIELTINVKGEKRLDHQLTSSISALDEVVVTSTSTAYTHQDIGAMTIDIPSIKVMPSMAGEPDPIKLLQLTPGVKSGGEGSSGLFVRGGNQDQNLILIDDAPVYNPTHLLGFFSVFHPDALKSIQLFKSNIPIEYGDRLSSVMDVRMKDGNKERFGFEGGIGLLSTRAMIEGPLSKNKSSYMVAFRRSYPDVFLGLSSSGGGNKVNFTDANLKLNIAMGERDKLFASTYFGKDNLRFFDQYENTWGNYTTSLRWHHLYGKNVFGNLTAYHSIYEYAIETFADNRQTINWISSISESAIKYDFNLFPSIDHEIKFGAGAIWRSYNPGQEKSGLLRPVPSKNVREYVSYAGHSWDVSEKIKLEYGARLNVFQTMGKDIEYLLDENRVVIDTLSLDTKQVLRQFHTLSPRFSLKYQLSDKTSLEASYNRNVQFQHEIRNASSPFNAFYVWLPSGINLPYGVSDQFTLGYQHILSKNFQLAIESYYKSLDNQIDYIDHASIIQNNLIEQEIRIGKGRAYGFEIQLEKTDGRLTGWLQYTYARTLRKIEGINDGEEYPAFYDQPHAASLVANYALNKRSDVGLNWQYASGQPVNLPIGSYAGEETIIPIYNGRNNERLPDFHRLDLSYTLRRKQGQWKNESYWVFSIINLYYRKNALSLDYLPNRDAITGNIIDPSDKRMYKTYLFGLIPSISWNFKF
jgi:hypothetical protein